MHINSLNIHTKLIILDWGLWQVSCACSLYVTSRIAMVNLHRKELKPSWAWERWGERLKQKLLLNAKLPSGGNLRKSISSNRNKVGMEIVTQMFKFSNPDSIILEIYSKLFWDHLWEQLNRSAKKCIRVWGEGQLKKWKQCWHCPSWRAYQRSLPTKSISMCLSLSVP